jgi:thymidylate synthase
MASVTNAIFYGESLADIYRNVCQMVVKYGKESSPRGQLTREVLAPTIVVYHPEDCLPMRVGRKPSMKVAVVEAVQLCGAFHDPEMMVAASPSFAQYREPYGQDFHGAYGKRISNQVNYVVNRLQEDPESRQAIVTLWSPSLDNLSGKKDYPCTISFQFLIRDDQLTMFTNMRSNDVWLGLAYDLFQFGQLQWTVANMLEIKAGALVHRPISLHAYDTDWDKIENLAAPTGKRDLLYGFQSVKRAQLIGTGFGYLIKNPTDTERWFIETLDGIERQIQPRA